MVEPQTWIPDDVDTAKPSSARIYDYLLGGGHNFEADREIAERFDQALPGSRDIARLNRAFLRRAVVHLAEQGIRQFLDIGSGIPTVGNVHQIAQNTDPAARVVYVDRDPIAVSHSEMLLGNNDNATIVRGDLRDVEGILDRTRRMLDFQQPVGLLMVGVLHFVPPDEDPAALLARYRTALAPGSHLALSHFTADSRPAEMAAMVEVMKRSADPIHPRTRAEFVTFFDGFDLVDPGVVATADWRPAGPSDSTEGPERDQILAGVGRLRTS
ncbi:SAM-dependent methyltransferase [Actinocrispum wychmicini]|uniref:S-adenosyl methyltransferase n=1 Tax=Actinocrispum wychmicini TaxID=1213861 RepID=A0A4R2JAF9_9PSEU|nr:SAM-dependent methyltransferase [Actinocrispum wychmicini]TCO54842.1 S-adenosyl methyltransferase [Actinocrispum wychmicini]